MGFKGEGVGGVRMGRRELKEFWEAERRMGEFT